MMRKLLSITLLALVSSIQADPVIDQLEAGRQAYENGEYRRAVDELNLAIAEIQRKIEEADKQLLPEPLPGWRAEEAEAQSMAMMGMGGSVLQRSYYREGGDERVELQIVADSPMSQMFTMMLSNPMLMQADSNTRLFRYRGQRGLMEHEAGSDVWEATLLLQGGRLLIRVKGSGLKDDQPIKAYLDALDFQRLQEALLR